MKLNYSYFHFDLEILKRLINLAIPIIIESIIISLLLGILINYALHLYAPPITAYAYVLIFRVQLVVFTPIDGLSKGFYTIIGHLFGAGRFVKIKKTIKKFILITFSIALAISFLLIIFNGEIISIFTSEFIVMNEVKNILIFVILYTILHSILHPAYYAFLGLGKSKYPLYFIIYDLIIFAVGLFIFNHTLQMGSFGVFLSLII